MPKKRLGPFPPQGATRRTSPPVPPPMPPPDPRQPVGPGRQAPPGSYVSGPHTGQFPVVLPGHPSGQFSVVPPGYPTGQFPPVPPVSPPGQVPRGSSVPRPLPPSGGYPVVPRMASAPPARGRDPRAAARRRERVKRFFIVLAGVLAIVLVVGGIAGYIYYDRQTRPNRSAPDVVVDNFLREYMVHRDDAQARQYSCRSQSGLADLAAFRADLKRREDQFAVKIAISWGPLATTQRPDSTVSVDTTMTLTTRTENGPQEQQAQWRFVTRQESGWRVCEAHAVA